jgi:hypothetical protein
MKDSLRKLPRLHGTSGAIKLAAEIRTKSLKSGKFEPMYLNLIRRINDADWWIVNRYDLTLGRFKHPAPRHLEQIPPKRKSLFAWFVKLWRAFFSNKNDHKIKVKATFKLETKPTTPIEPKPIAPESTKPKLKNELRNEESWRAW